MSPQYFLAAVICTVGAAVSWLARENEDQIGFWRGWWSGSAWAYVVGASVFLVLSALRLR